MENRPKPRICPVDYHLECSIEARFWKIAITGRKRGDKLETYKGASHRETVKWIYK
jgi:hypothetical protein